MRSKSKSPPSSCHRSQEVIHGRGRIKQEGIKDESNEIVSVSLLIPMQDLLAFPALKPKENVVLISQKRGKMSVTENITNRVGDCINISRTCAP